MTESSLSQSERIYSKGLTEKEYMAKYRNANKEQLTAKRVEYDRSKKGLVAKMYRHQRENSRRRNHAMPDYNLEELRCWVFSQTNFEEIYQNWVDSGFKSKQAPSCDRLDDYQPYKLGNLRLVTWQENFNRGNSDRKAGINNKQSKSVLQFTKDGDFVAEHHSANHASRVTGSHQGHLSACCRGELKTAGGFIWRFA